MAPDSSDGSDGDADDGSDRTTVQYTTDAWTAQSLIRDADAYPGHPPGSESEGDGGLLRIGFRDDEELTEVSDEEFREEFDERGLALVQSSDGSPVKGDRPLALVRRDDVEEEAAGVGDDPEVVNVDEAVEE